MNKNLSNSSLLELVGEELETVTGKIRVICNSGLHPQDVKTAKAAQMAIRRAWTSARPEARLQGEGRIQRPVGQLAQRLAESY